MRDICIVGVGNLGGALAIALSKAGYCVRELIVRDPAIAVSISKHFLPKAAVIPQEKLERIESEVIFITTADPAISEVAGAIEPFVSRRQVVFHTSGSLSSSVLETLGPSGAAVGSIHPLTSVSEPMRGSEQFRGTYHCVEGDAKAVRIGKQIVKNIGGHSFSIESEKKPLYHAAAVTSAGHVAALFDASIEIMAACGLDRKTAKKVLFPLLHSATANLANQAPVDALTGTFARLDAAAFERHTHAFRDSVSPEIVSLYVALGERSLDMIEQRDGPSAELTEFRKAVFIAKAKLRC